MDSRREQTQLYEMLRNPNLRDEGFRQLMSQYGNRLYWHIRRIVVGHDDAEDVLQETCIKILDNISSFRGDGQITTWIYSIATNESLRHLRRQTHLFQSIDSLAPTLISKLQAETSLDSNKAEVLFQKALLTLPTQQRIAFSMRYYDELSYEEISAITSKSIGTLKANNHYATEKIKKFIKEYGL